MLGHVFIAQGDLTQLACDAWLLPTDAQLKIEEHWLAEAPPAVQGLRGVDGRLRIERPPNWGDDGSRVIKLDPWYAKGGRSQAWLVNVGRWSGTEPDWYLEGVRQFLDHVEAGLRTSAAPAWRAVPLVALPVIGTGEGGADEIKGAVTTRLLEDLHAQAARRPFDIALVTHDHRALSAAQRARGDILQSSADGRRAWLGWRELSGSLLDRAEALAKEAGQGNLVLFLGAGVSTSAGLPTWDELLAKLASRVKLHSTIPRLGHLDLAHLIAGRFTREGRTPGDAVAELLRSRHYSLTHALLAALPVKEIATTNYDTLFEMASKAVHRPAAVLPWEPVAKRSRWLLKLHGCVDHPKEIVLSREDYLRYQEGRAALAGIVQALLITRHMLFVGFSLTDDNFHRIADDVRRALRRQEPGVTGDAVGKAPQPFATALFPVRDPFTAELWAGDVECVGIEEAAAADVSENLLLQAARHLEIFLDFLLSEATTNVAHVLDPSYADLLSPDEQELAMALAPLRALLARHRRDSAAWAPVRDLLDQLGDADQVKQQE